MQDLRVHPRLFRISVRMAALVLLVSPFFVLPNDAHAAGFAEEVRGNLFGLNPTAERVGVLPGVGGGTPRENLLAFVGNIIGAILTLVGVIFLVLVIYGGIKWMTAQGAEEEVEKAQALIRNAVIGLIIIVAAYAITRFVFSILVPG